MKRGLIILLAFISIFTGTALYPENGGKSKNEIAEELGKIAAMGGDHAGYSFEILEFLKKRYGIEPASECSYASRDFTGGDQGVEIDFYSLLSGGLAIRESLQLNTINESDDSVRDMDIRDLIPPKIDSHPFKQMLKGREYAMFPLDSVVPEEFYSVHFSDTTKALNFFDYLNDVGGTLHGRFTMTPVEFGIKEKIMTQLALKENREARAFYSKVIEEMSITGSDPFLIEGTDVSLVLKIKIPLLFNSTTAMYRDEFRKKFSADIKQVKIAGVEAELMTADFRKVNSILVRLPGDIVIISNSVKAAETIILTYQKNHASLADAPDYRYMRSIYKSDKKSEDGFIYLSEAFIRHLVSPELRIKEARRMAEAVKLARLEKYIIYYYQLKGKLPADVEEVLSAMDIKPLDKESEKLIADIKKNPLNKYVQDFYGEELGGWNEFAEALKVAEIQSETVNKNVKGTTAVSRGEAGRTRYIALLKDFYKRYTGKIPGRPADVFSLFSSLGDPSMDYSRIFNGLSIYAGSFTAVHEDYGRIGYMVPNIETETGMVSGSEADNYRHFTEEYSSYWKEYFDPIGIRFRFAEGGIEVDTCILPLIENSIYNSLKEICGGGQGRLLSGVAVNGDILSLAFRTDLMKIPVSVGVSESLDELHGLPDLNEIFGDEIQVHMGDVAPLVDIEGSAVMREFFRGGWSDNEMVAGFLVWSFFHPMRIAVPVKNPDKAEKFLDSIIMRERIRRSADFGITKYGTEYKGKGISVIKVNYFGIASSRFYYCISDGMLNFTTTEKYVKDLIDTGKKSSESVTGNIAVVFRPSSMVHEKGSYTSGIIEAAFKAGSRNNGTIKLLHSIFPDADSNRLPDLAFQHFGFRPVCPMGGTYSIDSEGYVVNSVYGSSYSPFVKDTTGESITSSALKRFFSTKEIRLEFEFTPEGIKTVVKTR